MSFPLFYYGFEITADNQSIDFIEGSGTQKTAYIDVGTYTPTTFVKKVKTALQTAGTLVYTVSFNRLTRAITIASTGGSHKLLTHSGTSLGNDCWALMGFSTAADSTLAASHTGSAAGYSYAPQIWLQDYVPSSNVQGASDAVVNKSADGQTIEVVKFGTESFMECNITWASSSNQSISSYYRPSTTGESDLRQFLRYLTTKGPVEFMVDETQPNNFEVFILESTTESNTGVKYRMKELWDKGLRNYYESGKLVFRVIKDV